MSPGTLRHNRRASGFTLIELMLAVTMLSVVIYLTLDSLTRQQKTALVTDQVVEVQNNLRAVSSLLEREIRMAGFMVPNAVGICGVDRTTGSDELFVSETEPIVPDDERAGTLGARLASTASWNSLTAAPAPTAMPPSTGTVVTLNLDATTTDLDGDGNYFYDNDGNGTPEADFRVNGGFILGDIDNPHRGAVCGTVQAATATQITIRVRGGQLATHQPASDAPEEIVIVPAAHYWVNPAAATGRLERNGDLLAHGIDDFQVSYFFDDNDDGVVDANGASPAPNEERATATGDTVYSATDAFDEDNSALREVRFSLVLRTRATDPDFDDGGFIVFENRAAVPGNDNFRRRVMLGSVRPRNIGMTGSI